MIVRRQWTDHLVHAVLGLWFAYLLLGSTVGLGLHWIDSWHNEQRAGQVALLVLSAAAALALAAGDADFRGRLAHLHPSIALFFLLGLASTALAQRRFDALADWSLHLLLAALVVLVAHAVRRTEAPIVRWALYAALFIGAAHVVGIGVRYAAALHLGNPLDMSVLLLGYANPRFPSALYALLLPPLAALAVDARCDRRLRPAAVCVLALLWAANLALGTRAVAFAYALALPATAALIGWSALRPVARVLLATAAAGVVAYLLLFQLVPPLLGLHTEPQDRPEGWGSLSRRELLYASAAQAIASAPLLGIGPHQFSGLAGSWAAQPHNWVLQVAAEWGLVALLLLLAALAALARRVRASVRGGSEAAGPPAVALTLGSAVALFYGLVDGNLVMPVSQSTAALTLGLLLGTIAAPAPPARNTRAGGTGRLAPAALALAGAAVSLGAYTLATLPRQPAAETAYREASPGWPYWPRYWQQGFLDPRSPRPAIP